MSIENQEQTEERNEVVIPKFNPEGFLDDNNDVNSGSLFFAKENTGEQSPDASTVESEGQEQEQNENTETNEEERQISFDDDFTSFEDDDTEEEFNPDNYKVLSETLGVKIETKEDLENIQSKIKGESTPAETQTSKNYNFSEEESKSYDTLDKALVAAEKSSDEDIMKWHLKRVNEAKYKENPDELEYHIDSLKETGLFDDQVKGIREKLVSEISGQKNSLISNVQERETKQSLEINRELEKEIKSYKEGFHGIKLDPKDMLDTFKSIKNGTVFEEIESKQANVAEMALLWKNRELFYKAFESPDPSVGVRKVMEELQNSRPKAKTGGTTLKNPLVFDPQAFLNSEDVKQVSSGN